MSPKEAAHKTMDEVGGALIAISLVLCAVFVPTAFITGLQGSFYQPVCGDHRGVDSHIGVRVAHFVSGDSSAILLKAA